MGFMLTTVDTQRELAAEALLSKSVVLKQDSDFPEGFTSLLLGLGGLRFCCVANKMLVNKKHLLHIYIYTRLPFVGENDKLKTFISQRSHEHFVKCMGGVASNSTDRW